MKRNLRIISALILALAGSSSFATTILVKPGGSDGNTGQDWQTAKQTVQAGIDAAQSGDQVWVAAGVYKPTTSTSRGISFSLKEEVEVYGGFIGNETSLDQRDWLSNVTTLSGDIGTPGNSSDNSYHVVKGANGATLDGFTVTSGYAYGGWGGPYDGAGMYNSSASPNVRNCTFSGNWASGDGGGMYNYMSSPTVINCIFSGNYADLTGGGMYNHYSSSPTVTGCTFSSNSAGMGGGGVWNGSGSPVFADCTFSSNSVTTGGGGGMRNDIDCSPTVINCIFTANGNGAAMSNDSDTARIIGCSFTQNSDGGVHTSGDATIFGCTFAENSGGGMDIYIASPDISDCTFTGNQASLGAGIYIAEGSPTITDCIFSGNEAGSIGGGMLVGEPGAPKIIQCTFIGNSAVTSGGGVYLTQNSTAVISDCTFTENSSVNGGGINNSSGSGLVTGCTFARNTATNGAGMYASSSDLIPGSPTVAGCMFDANTASGDGGGMYNGSGSSPTLVGLSFTANTAVHGGGMYNYATYFYISGCSFAANSASMYGGGMLNNISGGDVRQCSFVRNSAQEWGGGMYNQGGTQNITNCTFNGNTSGVKGGGGMFNTGNSTSVVNCCFVFNTAVWGGALYNYNYSDPSLINCTIAGNSAGTSGGGMHNNLRVYATLTNCIVSSNTAPIGPQIYNEDFSSASVSYSNIEGGWPGVGNINLPPQFVNSGTGDMRLQGGSPCVDAGDNSAVPAGVTTDLTGNPRINNGTVDLGAYEYGGQSFQPVSIRDAKSSEDGTQVRIESVIVSAAWADVFYAEADDRSCGVRVEKGAHGLTQGMRADITGNVQTNADGEKYIAASGALVRGAGSVRPLGMQFKSIGGNALPGGVGLGNVGLLVKTWGKVVEVEPVTPPAVSAWFKIDDGSGVNVKCVVPSGVSIDPAWVYVGVTGISSCEKIGNNLARLIRVRTDGDIVPYVTAP